MVRPPERVIYDNLIGIKGKVFDVDHLKKLLLKVQSFNKKVKEEFGVDLSELDLKRAEDTRTLHYIVSTLGLADKRIEQFMKQTTGVKEKPNIIFDVTLKSISKLDKITNIVTKFGYKRENIHIVWIVNSIDMALQQNAERDRRVPNDILKDTHKMVAAEMKRIFSGDYNMKKYMDGDFWIVFNKRFIDNLVAISDFGGSYIKEALYFKVKEKGKKMKELKEFSSEVVDKILDYTEGAFK